MFEKILTTFLIVIFSNQSYGKEIALSFDDAPTEDSNMMSGLERTEKIINALRNQSVNEVVFFVTTKGLENPEGIKRIQKYNDAGYLIANHSNLHQRPSELGVDKYIEDIKIAHNKIKYFKNFFPYYRFPYLDWGDSLKIKNKIQDNLQSLNYKNGYVTIDTSDWYINSILQNIHKKNLKIDYNRFKETYIATVLKSFDFFENLSQQTLKSQPKHILLLHENDLTALFLEDLIKSIRHRGWKIISPKDAYLDPISNLKLKTIKHNDGLIAAIAYENSFKGLIRDPLQDTNNVKDIFLKSNSFELHK